MKINLEFKELKDKNEALPDIYNCMVYYNKTLGGQTFQLMSQCIHNYNDQNFFTNGEIIPREDIISYAKFDVPQLQSESRDFSTMVKDLKKKQKKLKNDKDGI